MYTVQLIIIQHWMCIPQAKISFLRGPKVFGCFFFLSIGNDVDTLDTRIAQYTHEHFKHMISLVSSIRSHFAIIDERHEMFAEIEQSLSGTRLPLCPHVFYFTIDNIVIYVKRFSFIIVFMVVCNTRCVFNFFFFAFKCRPALKKNYSQDV